MALISIIEDFHPLNDAKLLYRADELTPSLHHEIVEPVGGFQLKERYSPEREEIVLQKVPKLAMGKGQNLCLDFGDHYVGYLTLEFSYTGSHPDAPAFLKLKSTNSAKTPTTMMDGSPRAGSRKNTSMWMFFPPGSPCLGDTHSAISRLP